MLILSISALAEERKKVDKIVNKHLTKEAQEKELRRQKALLELRKNQNTVPPKAEATPDPAVSIGIIQNQEPNAFSNEKPADVFKPLNDPGSEIQRDISQEKLEYEQSEYEKRLMIQKLKKEAEKSGYKVNVVPAETAR